ncbi:hypothetical protein L596_012883 [Steinernema carpocapsae]|uniref:Uncharacterized protein n=1 Tax=Steinernema carpocapsae TaxID=34508 RepID=A0A4U5NYE4_STECR|nr:hypothetical protein L596_012883 [Steinernema carpocapsae]
MGNGQGTPYTREEIHGLYRSLNFDYSRPLSQPKSLLVHIAKGTVVTRDLEWLFSEFNPTVIDNITETTWAVTFGSAYEAAKAVFESTEAMKRVHIDENGEANVSQTEEEKPFVLVDAEKMNVPKGKWRLVTKKLRPEVELVLRFVRSSDFRPRFLRAKAQQQKEGSPELTAPLGRGERIYRGLNIFDEEGEELDWDYEHDTRFFPSVAIPATPTDIPQSLKRPRPVVSEDEMEDLPGASRGRPYLDGGRVKHKGRGQTRFWKKETDRNASKRWAP